MDRVQRQLFQLNDELGQLRREAELVEGELEMHRHLDDDATRDALVSDAPLDRAAARQTAKEVARMRKVLAALRRQIDQLERRRTELLEGLGAD